MIYDLTPSVELLLNFMKEGALTFILVFSLVYYLLHKVKIFKTTEDKPDDRINIVVALVLAIAAITPHFTTTYYGYGEAVDVVEIVNRALPSVSLLIVMVVLFLIVVSVFGVDWGGEGTVFSGLVIIFSLLAIIYIFLTSAGIIVEWDILYWIDEEIKNLILIILVMAVIIYFITGGGGEGTTALDTVGGFLKSLTKKSK